MSKKPEFADLFFSKIKDFLDIFLKNQEQRSRDTIKAYRISLSSFYKYVTEVKGMKVMQFCFSDCTYEFVLSYSQYLQETQKLANSTVNQRLAALKSYLKYVSDGDIALMQIYMAVQKVPLLKTPKLQRPVIEKEALKAFLAEPKNTKIGRRDRVLLTLLYDTAVRVSELTGIVLGDMTLNVKNPSIIIHGKGKKTRSIVLNKKCADLVKDYVLHYHEPDALPDTPLFYTMIHGKMNHMSQRNVERIVKKYGDSVRKEHPSLPDKTYPHMLRRSRATGLYRDGVPLELVSAILGHASSETTKIYAIPSVEQMREALSKGYSEEEEAEKIWEGKEAEIRRLFGLE